MYSYHRRVMSTKLEKIEVIFNPCIYQGYQWTGFLFTIRICLLTHEIAWFELKHLTI